MNTMFKIIIPIICITLIQSCGQSDSQTESSEELENLRSENEILKAEIDSLNSILENEKLEPIALNNSYRLNLTEGDSIEFLFGLFYNRPNLASTFYADIFTNQDSLKLAQDDPNNYQFMYEIDLLKDEPVASIPLSFPYINSDFCVVGGVMEVQSATGIKYIPLQFNLNL
ncbi:hypothetical protein K6119_08075 [Paracrocinitomix mangrovi]|uniref:hypothetical protein n=1 Tax=Paracrocinitomix mangrovi TaxID=2862509 RepID=UPI001C8D8421|nr:hypothetical protein [Paracrocinitomix mangrovi]UKN03469.1 hypothetical protein K6119_08075 [Paracrocinitomix mangrovi]